MRETDSLDRYGCDYHSINVTDNAKRYYVASYIEEIHKGERDSE